MKPIAHVLVAEDDSPTRRFLQQALEFGGYRATCVEDGTEAIAMLNSPGRFDVVVTDYSMPRTSGLDVIVHAQMVDASLPCIVVTAFRDLDLAMRAMQAGAVAFLPKPFKADHLLTVIDSAVQRRSLAYEAMRLRLLAPMLEQFTMVLANTLESRDTATQWHANRLVSLAGRVADHIGIDGDLRTAIRYGACLHDIGKVAVPERVLHKATSLTDEEFAIIRLHPEVGAMILESIDTWDDVRSIVRHHHERFDGTGYPNRLRGEAIPLGARIVAVVDAFDVMRVGRPYAPARSESQIHDELERGRGTQFDPAMVAALLEVISLDDFLVPPAELTSPTLIASGTAHLAATSLVGNALHRQQVER
ncbi:MAG: response regulator [Candidatus Dormibacteraeota bacterium]|nr:response regulator [Candidatus Dormibacteraeota bacterium]